MSKLTAQRLSTTTMADEETIKTWVCSTLLTFLRSLAIPNTSAAVLLVAASVFRRTENDVQLCLAPLLHPMIAYPNLSATRTPARLLTASDSPSVYLLFTLSFSLVL